MWSPSWHDDEHIGSAIVVQPFELTHVPYESAQMREKRLREAAERDAKRSTDPEGTLFLDTSNGSEWDVVCENSLGV